MEDAPSTRRESVMQDAHDEPQPQTSYQVCNLLIDPETNEHCEFDGVVPIDAWGIWHCPSCNRRRMAKDEGDFRP